MSVSLSKQFKIQAVPHKKQNVSRMDNYSYLYSFGSIQQINFNPHPYMTLPIDSLLLQWVWDFLGAVYIKSDLVIALQSHAAERQYNNWVFHTLIDDEARRVFDTVNFFSRLAHPCLSARMQDARQALYVLRCVNKDLKTRSLNLLKERDIDPYDFICASRPIEFPCTIITQLRNLLNDLRRRKEKEEFQKNILEGVRQDGEDQQRERICRLRLLEDSLERLIPMNVRIALSILYYEQLPQTPAFHRMFNGEIFSWMQCVERWGHDFETGELYEWFAQLEKVD